MTAKPYLVLIADDSEADRYFLKRAIQNGAPRLKIVAEVETGADVVAYLSGQGSFADRNHYPLPQLLILDSRMPGVSGLDVLEWLQSNPVPGLKVAMFADSSGLDLQSKAMQLGANFFCSKIVDSDELSRTVRTLQADLDLDKRMKVLLRHKSTQQYFLAADQWTPLLHDALDFESFETAVDFARNQNLVDVAQIAVVFAANGQTFFFPIIEPSDG
jgi:CheY-like chemotaxis protein